jgi:FdhE protein
MPDLEPAVALQRRLVRLMLDATAALGEPSAPLEPSATAGNWQKGLPALRNEAVAIPAELKRILPPICTALAEGGAGDSALHIGGAIASGDIDADSLLRVSLARNQKAIRTSALHMGFSPDLVWLIGELASAPLANALQQRSLGPGTGMQTHAWNRGYCPFCGSWPVFIEFRIDAHTLRCSYCALDWALASRRCVYCANDGSDFVTAAIDVQAPERRVELCGRCSGYTKVIGVSDATPFPLLAIRDLATMNLDQGAMSRGYRRPDLFDLDAIEPRTSAC